MAAIRFRYHTLVFGDVDIHLRTLRDRQEFDDPNNEAETLGVSPSSWPMFGVVWAAGEVLAGIMQHHDIEGLRILEVGCGVGVASLMLNQRAADITATDHHPVADRYLQYNAALNDGAAIPFFRQGWEDSSESVEQFDLIIGSDLLYEPNHAELLSGFIDAHARPTSEVIIIDGGRGHAARFSKRMGGYGFSVIRSAAEVRSDQDLPFKGSVLSYQRSAA
jgi:predicted nicotinamide N-methyase